MLSHHDRRRLAAIEQRLESDDPHLAERFDRWSPSRVSRRGARGAVLMIVVGALGTLAGLLLSIPSMLAVFLTALIAGLIWLARARRAKR
jgi:Flp pilus assembly protein TadB